MTGLTVADLRNSVRKDRVHAVSGFGFTERQARFLVNVLVHSGVFLERQYCAFAGIVHGQKTHDFLAKLVSRRYATVITPGALHRGRIVHVQYKPLYEAIGEENNRNRKPASLGRMVERLMILDAVLADTHYTWLGTENDKLRHFVFGVLKTELKKTDYPHLTFGDGERRTVRYFPDKLPIAALALAERSAPPDKSSPSIHQRRCCRLAGLSPIIGSWRGYLAFRFRTWRLMPLPRAS